MGKRGKRILAILAALALICALFAGCKNADETGGTDVSETGTPVDSQAITTSASAVEVSVDPTGVTGALTDTTGTGISTQSGTDTTTAVAGVTTGGTAVNGTTAATTTKAAVKKPSTTAEIVAYFNAAANKVKTDKPGYTFRDRTIIDDKNVTSSSGAIDNVAGPIIGLFASTTKWADSSTAKGANHNQFPVSGQAWASKLTVADIKDISITDGGKVYKIRIVLKDENLSAPPANVASTMHGRIMNIWTKPDIDEGLNKAKAFATIDKFSPQYSGSYVNCTIDKGTGNLQTITYYSSAIVKMHISKILLIKSNVDVSIPIAQESQYTIG